jgi:2-polyprenyl-3-methyl-5-hydroxy-6-metoxy-1,4-benzoquinol methylase
MSDGANGKQKARDYYGQEAKNYIKQYQGDYSQYPANLIRINFIVERLRKNKVRTILDAGCGTCGPMIKLLKEGFNVRGFDFSEDMVEQGKKELRKVGCDPNLIYSADLEDASNLPTERFDAVLALGVFPHILDEKRALSNMGKLLNPRGVVFIEFRNDLFAAYTLNKYSVEFFLNRVVDLDSLPQVIRDEVIDFYSSRFQVDKPIRQESGKIRYEDILAKFRNPLSIKDELFEPCNFSIVDIYFYHYHALPPTFKNKHPGLFRKLSLKMEKPHDWRGYLMASAYVIEARVKD